MSLWRNRVGSHVTVEKYGEESCHCGEIGWGVMSLEK